MENRFCPECGQPVLVTAKFCERCGHRLNSSYLPSSSPKVMGANRANEWARTFLKLGVPPLDNHKRKIVNQAFSEDRPHLGKDETVICNFPVKASPSSTAMFFLKELFISKRDITIEAVVADNSAGEQLFFLDDGFFIVTNKRLVFSSSDGSWGKITPTTGLVTAEVGESSKQVFWLALSLESGTTFRCLFNLPHASIGTTVSLFHEDSVVRESSSHQLRQAEATANDARSIILVFFNELAIGAT